MKPASLLSLTDPRYVRRLARECNALPDGFYVPSLGGQGEQSQACALRCNRARLKGDTLEARVIGGLWLPISHLTDQLIDAYGRSVTASRTP